MPKKILLIRFSALGDLVTLEPVMRAYRHFYPRHQICLLTSGLGKQLFEHYVDRCVAISPTRKMRLPFTRKIIKQQFSDEQFELIVDLQCNTGSMLFATLLSAERRVYRSRGPLKKIFGLKAPGKTLPVLFQAGGIPQHSVNEYFSDSANHTISLNLPSSYVEAIQQKFKLSEILTSPQGTKKIIAIAPGASPGWPSKQWGEDNYGQLAQLLEQRLEQAGYLIMLVGSPDESRLCETVAQQCKQALNLCGQTTIRELATLLSQAELLIGNDSGPAHLAAATGTATVTIFGSTDVKHSVAAHGYAGRHTSFSPSQTSCAPCYKGQCPIQHECMQETHVSAVLQRALQQLGE